MPLQRHSSETPITDLLVSWQAGHHDADERLMSRVYPQLRAMAELRLGQAEHPSALQATELVHEVYLRMRKQRAVSWQCEAQFFAVVARFMRRILIDHARYRRRQKRGGGLDDLPLDQAFQAAGPETVDWLRLDGLLQGLERIQGRAARVAELRIFADLDVASTARMLQVSQRTVARDWRFARAWLRRQLDEPS